MLQRNTSGYPIELPTLGLGRQIHPGEDFDFEERLAGFTPVTELEAPDESDTPDKSGDDALQDTDPDAQPVGNEPDTGATDTAPASDSHTPTDAQPPTTAPLHDEEA